MTRSRKRKLQRLLAGASARRLSTGLPLASFLLAGLPAAHAQDTNQGAILEEVVVTAQKQQENLQAVPMSIQALGAEKLEQLRINSLEDAIKFVPSVSVQSYGPGFTRVFMRGVSSGDNGNHSGPMPSVGQYLDEQPITTIQGSLDIHIYDIERVEILEGPQGTLYGASSQAGTIRTITNKPDAEAFSASYDLQGSFVESGGTGYTAEGYVNVPINDRMAVRLVGWYEHTPGYIDNVQGTQYYPTSDTTLDNTGRTKKNYNDVDIYGARAALKIDLNDSWSITPAVMGQETKTNGVFAYDDNIGDLQVAHFFPENSRDSWIQAALTIEGKIGNFDVVYAGAYLDRNDDISSDYSDYSYWYDNLTTYGSYWVNNDGDPINWAQYIKGKDGYKMWSNELRISSPRDQRFRFVAGLFGQNATHDIEQRYVINDLADSISVTGWPDTVWLTEQTRTDKSFSIFGEMYYDIMDNLTATAGIRVFWTDANLKGFYGFNYPDYSSTGEPSCFNQSNFNGAPCINLNKSTSENGNTPKFNLTYRFDDERMVYATYSEGFRPGGVNRNSDFGPYKADYLKNYEVGWKTTWAGGKVRFNGAAFYQKWDDFQWSYLGPNGLTIVTNAGGAKIPGIETYVDWAAAEGLLLSAGAMWLDGQLTQSFCRSTEEIPCTPEHLAPSGTKLPVTPSFKGNVVARYNWKLGEFDATVQGNYSYQNDVRSDLIPYGAKLMGKQDSFGIADFSGSLKRGPYTLTLFIDNAFDERADLFKYTECDVEICGLTVGNPYTTYTGTNMPRTIGLIFRQEF